MNKNIFLFVAALAAFGEANAAVLDGLAAKVNSISITIDEVKMELQRNPELREKALNAKPGNIGEIYTNTVNNLIDRKLILKSAADRKLDMQEWLVDNRVREIVKERFDGDMNKLSEMLTQARVPITEWRNSIREDMIIASMRFQMVDKFVSVSPSAMRKEYNENKSKYNVEESTSVRVILLRPAPEGDALIPPVTTRAEEILGRLDNGEDFATLAKKYSSDSKAKDGGLWKNVNPEEQFRSEIVETISKLKPGEYSRLINLDGWGFIVRKENEQKARSRTFMEAYEDIESALREKIATEKYNEWVSRLRKNQYIEIFPLPETK
jgi:parvulin-like peptidyl-prolyl isomerase